MRRLIAALAALLIASPALASVLVIDYASSYPTTSEINSARATTHVVEGYLKTVRPAGGYMLVDANASKPHWIRNGYHVTGWNGSTGTALHQFDVVFVVNWQAGISPGLDSTINGATTGKWATKPIVFVGPVLYGFGKWTQTTACSTGIVSNVGVTSRVAFSYAYYSTKGSEVFRGASAQRVFSSTAGKASCGIWRALLAYGIASNYITTSGVTYACTDCDFVTRQTSSNADSVAVWAKYRSSAETAPLIFCDLGSNYDPRTLAIAAAHADSASGGRVIGRTRKTAIMVSGMFRTNAVAPSINVSNSGLGLFVPASGTVDTLNMQSSADSIAALRVPLSIAVQVNTDTLAALAYQGRILRRIPLAKLTPQDYAGTSVSVASGWFGTTGMGLQKGNAAGRYRVVDAWGVTRARAVGPATSACAATDSSIFCVVAYSLQRADSIARVYGLAGVDRVVWAPYMDWTPSGITKTTATLVDSVLFYAYKAGVRGFMQETLDLDGSIDLYKSPATQPYGYSYSQKSIRFRDPATGVVAGAMPVLVSRGSENVASSVIAAMHDVAAEHANGWIVGGPWFWSYDGTLSAAPALVYYHDFYLPTQVMTVNASAFGGDGDGTQPKRWGFWQIKSLAHFVSMENSWAWPQHKASRIVYPEDLAGDNR